MKLTEAELRSLDSPHDGGDAVVLADLVRRLQGEIDRLGEALNDAAEMSEYDDRTLIYNHCKQAVEGGGE